MANLIVSLLLLFGCQYILAEYDSFMPQQVRISIGVEPDQMVVLWSTYNDTGETKVMYGTNGKLTMIQNGTRYKFVDGGSKHKIQYINKVVLQDLFPETKYYYTVGSSSYGWSNMMSFRTWPRGENWSPSIVLYGDLGSVNAQSLPRLELDTQMDMYDAVIHIGDFAYNLEYSDGQVGDEFMRQIEPIASKLPYMTCPGNHEAAYNFSNYRHRFEMPGDAGKRMYFSFNMGPIHFISLNTEQIFNPGLGLTPIIQHFEWLKQDLKEANKPENRAKRPWIITFGHRPMYCSNNDTDDCTYIESLTRTGLPIIHDLNMEKLFFETGVDVELWAHEHSYERFWPVYNWKVLNGTTGDPYVEPEAPIHLTTGSAGCSERHDYFKEKQAWTAFRSLDYGYTRMKVFNATHLYMEQVSDDQGGKVIDKVMIVKKYHGPYAKLYDPIKPQHKLMLKKLKIEIEDYGPIPDLADIKIPK